MNGRYDSTHAALIRGNGGKNNPLRENAFFEETLAEAHRQCAFAHYYRRNWCLAISCIESKLLQTTFKEGAILPETFNKTVIFFQNLYGRDAGGYYRGRMRGTEEHRASALQ